MVCYSHLFKNFPQFVVAHTVKGFGIVNKAEIDVFFLELSCFFHDPVDVGNLISGSSAFSKTSLKCLKMVFFSPSLLQAQRDFHYENLVTPGGKSHENVKPSGFPLEFLTLEFVHNEPPSINNYKFGAPALGLFPAMVLLLVFCLGLRLSAAVVCVSSLGAWFSL